VLSEQVDQLPLDVRTPYLKLKSEIAAQAFLRAGRRLIELLRKAGFNPAQLRVPAGQSDGGQWAGGDEANNTTGSDGGVILTAGPGGRSGYPVDILEEDALGGHTVERHVAKPEEYLKARILGSRINVFGIITAGERRAGSFTSIEAANKLVNSTLAQNQDKVDAFVARRFPSILPFMNLFADFDSPTGYEVYAPNDRAQPRMRQTYGVTVHIRRSDQSDKGYFVHSSWPMNKD